MQTLTLLTAPSEQPVTLIEAKEFLRVDETADDSRISAMIVAATRTLEAHCNQKFISQQWAIYFDCFPMKSRDDWWDGVRDGAISELYSPIPYLALPIGPIRAVDEFNTYADDGVAVPFTDDNFVVDTKGPWGRIALKLGAVWPTTILRKVNAIEIKVTVGVAADAATTPEEIKQAILETVAKMYENRGDVDKKIPNVALNLLEPYVRYKAR